MVFDEVVILKAVEISSRFTGSKEFDLKLLQDECERHYNEITGRVIEIRNKIAEPKTQDMCQETANQLQKRKRALVSTFSKDSEIISNYINICRTIK